MKFPKKVNFKIMFKKAFENFSATSSFWGSTSLSFESYKNLEVDLHIGLCRATDSPFLLQLRQL